MNFEPAALKQALRGTIRSKPLYFGLVVAPLLILFLYLAVIASHGYISNAQLIVERDSTTPAAGLDLSMLGLGSSNSSMDALLIQDFITSPAMVDYLQQTLDLRSHYRGKGVDFISGKRAGATNEAFHDYFLSHVDVEVDSESTTITLNVSAFDPAYAQKVAQAIVKRSEDFVNSISQQMARDQLNYIQAQVDEAGKRMHKAADELVALQRQYKVLSPEAETETSSRIVGALEDDLAKSRTDLKALQAYLNPRAPEVVAAQTRIAAIQHQLEQERAKQVGGAEQGVNDLVLRYQAAQLNVQLTTDLYQAALKSLEMTRLDASRKGKYLVQVSPPTLPDQAELPQIWRTLFAALVILNLGYFVASLLIAAVKEHRD